MAQNNINIAFNMPTVMDSVTTSKDSTTKDNAATKPQRGSKRGVKAIGSSGTRSCPSKGALTDQPATNSSGTRAGASTKSCTPAGGSGGPKTSSNTKAIRGAGRGGNARGNSTRGCRGAKANTGSQETDLKLSSEIAMKVALEQKKKK